MERKARNQILSHKIEYFLYLFSKIDKFIKYVL